MRQKEQLKRLRAEVDVLTLTATPIPRTLAMSLEGIRDFSVIATAPQRRLAIKTFVVAVLARHHPRGRAARAEARRPGLFPAQRHRHDRARRPNGSRELVPEARIAVAHGQMAERELEHVMRDFYAQRVNLLVCSTIIETGIDVPTREHDHHRARRPLRPRAAAPAARPRRPLAPPGLRVPADAARARRCRAQAKKRLGRDPDDGGPGFGLPPRDARPRDPRRRRSARRVAVGRDAGGRLPALRRHAEVRGLGAQGRAASRISPRRSA